VLPPAASVTGLLVSFITIAIFETTKLTEYILEPLGRLANARVWEMFWSFNRSTVADPPLGVIVMVCGVIMPF
jgi:hypothetical protein